jgi:hypothetical protein
LKKNIFLEKEKRVILLITHVQCSFSEMSICFSGQESIDPSHNQTINQKPKQQGNDIIDIGRILFEGIKKDTVERKRKKRFHEKISNESDFLKSLRQASRKRRKDKPRFFDISTDHDNKEIKDRKCVDDVIECMDSPNTKRSPIDVRSRDEKLSFIKLKDQNDVQAHKKHRSKHDGEHKDCQDFEKVRSIRYIRYPKKVIEYRRADVIPIRVSVCVNSATNGHHDHKNCSIQSNDCCNNRKQRELLFHALEKRRF